jgi:hypothetical protein
MSMKIRRRTVLYGAGIPVLLVLLLATLPLLFRDRIAASVRAGIDRRIDAHVAWGGVGVSVLRDFPNITVRLDDLAITGSGDFEGDTLLAIGRLRTELDLRSVLRSVRGTGPVVIRAIDLDRPVARLLTLADGRSNWEVVPERDAAASASGGGVAVSLRRLALHAGVITFDDMRAGTHAAVTGLQQTVSGDFAQQHFVLRSELSAAAVSVKFAGIPYLSQARLVASAEVDADMVARRFTVRDNGVRLNDLVLQSSGSLSVTDDSVAVDLSFSTPRTAFADILSLVPALYSRSFATLETAGIMSVAGRVHGGVGGARFPALSIAANVEDGSFRYPDLPLPARDIALELVVTNAGGSADATVVRLDHLHLVLGSDPIAGSFVLRTPLSDPDVAFSMRGRLDLADLGRTVKLDGVDELAGIVVADASMRARQSDVELQRYDRITADGSIELTSFVMRGGDLPRAVAIEQALLRLSPQHAELVAFRGRSGNSDLAMTGSLDNLIGFVLRDEVLRGEARVTSAHLDLNEWRSADDARAMAVPANLDFALHAEIARLTFGTLDMRRANGALRVLDQRATLEDFRVDMLGGSMAVSGFYDTTDPLRPAFDVDLGITDFDVPAAFAGLATVRAFAPVAQYAEGRMSADLRLAGALGTDMAPVLEVLSGLGSLRTAGLLVKDFPAFERLARLLDIGELREPALRDLRSTFEIRDGRLHVRPFDVAVGPFAMHVAGSNGLDQSLDYQLALQLPRAALGATGTRLVASLAAPMGRAGIELEAADVIGLGVRLTGPVTDPTLRTDLREVAGATARTVEQALRQEATSRLQAVEQRADEAADEARRQAQAEAERLIAEAEQRAALIREEARALAERARTEGHARADSLVARAGTPLARAAARTAADRLRRETDDRADRIVQEADARADALVAEARRRAGGPD